MTGLGVSRNRWAVYVLAFSSVVSLVITTYCFLIRVECATEYATFGDVEYYVQLWYNFTHGNPFVQSSYYSGGGVGFVNTEPYINMFAIHATVTQFVLAPFGLLFPGVTGHYFVHITSIYIILGVYGWKLTRLLAKDTQQARMVYPVFLIAMSSFGLFDIIRWAGSPLSISAGLLLAAVYYLKSSKYWRYILVLVAVLLTSEDASLVVAGVGVYVYFFEKRQLCYSLVPFLLGVSYLVFITKVVQPAVWSGYTVTHGSYAALVFEKFFSPASEYSIWGARWWTEELPFRIKDLGAVIFLYLLAFVPRIVRGNRDFLLQSLGLGFVAGGGYWALSIMASPLHHFAPLVGLGLSLVIIELCGTSLFSSRCSRSAGRSLYLLVLLCFTIGAVENMHQYFPFKAREALADVRAMDFSFPRAVASFETRYNPAAGYRSNQEVKSVVSQIPGDKTVTYFANGGVGAFVASRVGYWRYPSFYGRADYLLIQKDILLTETPGVTVPLPPNAATIPPDFVNRLRTELVTTKGSHMIDYESGHVLLLKRREQSPLRIPNRLRWFNFLFQKNTDLPDQTDS